MLDYLHTNICPLWGQKEIYDTIITGQQSFNLHQVLYQWAFVHVVCRKLMKAKGPAAAKVEEEKKKGLALFGPKPPTPKLLRAVGGTINKRMIDKMKVTTLFFQLLFFKLKYLHLFIVKSLPLC